MPKSTRSRPMLPGRMRPGRFNSRAMRQRPAVARQTAASGERLSSRVDKGSDRNQATAKGKGSDMARSLADDLSAALERLFQGERGGVLRLQLQGLGDLVGRDPQRILCYVEPGEYQEGRRVGLEAQGDDGFGSRVRGIVAALADLGETGMGGRTSWIGGDRGLKVALRLRHQAPVDGVPAEGAKLGGLLRRREHRHARGAKLGKLEGRLPVAGLGVGPPDTLYGAKAGGVGGGEFGAGGGGLQLALQFERFVVVG